jgi:cobalamin biosynthesis protein CobT
MLGGSENVFKRRWEAEGINTAVSILIDGSSSMDGERIRAAQSLTLALADIIEKTGSEYEINVFQSGNEESAGRAREERDIHGSYGSSTPKTAAAAVLIEVKGWAQRKAERQHLQMIARLTNGGTPDYSALHNVVRGISTRPEQRKIVIVLTDGFGDVADVRRTCEAAEKMGINVLAFGLMTENIERVYPNSVAVASLDGLDEAALNRVVATLQKTESKRRLF